jgi:hypothetical protein
MVTTITPFCASRLPQYNGIEADPLSGKQQSADVGGSGDFAVELQLIERFGRNCLGEDKVKAIGQWSEDHVGEENRERSLQ